MKLLLAASAALVLAASAAPSFAYDWNYGHAVGARHQGRRAQGAAAANPDLRNARRAARRAARAARQDGPYRPFRPHAGSF